jgi:hypothetical protein
MTSKISKYFNTSGDVDPLGVPLMLHLSQYLGGTSQLT